MTEDPVLPSEPVWPHVITDTEGMGVDETWSASEEGRDHGIALSTIHLDTARVDIGPPQHQHPYTEVDQGVARSSEVHPRRRADPHAST